MKRTFESCVLTYVLEWVKLKIISDKPSYPQFHLVWISHSGLLGSLVFFSSKTETRWSFFNYLQKNTVWSAQCLKFFTEHIHDFLLIWGFCWVHLIQNLTRISEIFSWNFPVGPKFAELKSLLQTLFLTLAVLTQIKAVAKARDPKSPEREIQTGLNCGYDGLSEVILSFTHSSAKEQERKWTYFPSCCTQRKMVVSQWDQKKFVSLISLSKYLLFTFS